MKKTNFELPDQKRIEPDDENTRGLAYMCACIMDFASQKEWYDDSFAKKSYDLLEKGYTLNEYQIKRIFNAWDLICHIINEQSQQIEALEVQLQKEEKETFPAFCPEE